MPEQPMPPPESEPQETGRERLKKALSRPTRGQLTAGLLLGVLGFAAVVQVQSNGRDDTYAGMRQSDLVQLINSLSLASQRAEKSVNQLEQTRDSLRNDTNSRGTALERAREQADALGILAGTLPAIGPGITVTVIDPGGLVGTNQLLNCIMELRDAGAEAIEINDSVRVVAQTSFRDGPNGGVIVDGEPLSPPYTLSVIGDPATLAPALEFIGGFTSEVEDVGGTVSIERRTSVEIASTREPETPDYAEPVPITP